MTQPTQEDIKQAMTEILGYEYIPVEKRGRMYHVGVFQGPNNELLDERYVNPYTDDSFTGALIEAVFPLLAEQGWYIEPGFNGLAIFNRERHHILYAHNLNTALIEAWKKIENDSRML